VVVVALDFWVKVLLVARGAQTAPQTEGAVAQAAQMAQTLRRVFTALEEIMAVVRARHMTEPQSTVNQEPVLYALFGQERPVHSHQQTQVTCK